MPTNSVTSFVGRSQELSQLTALIKGFRLVVILGPGGMGKTRLAHQVASITKEGSAVFVDLANAQTHEDVTQCIAVSFKLTGQSSPKQIGDTLAAHGPLLLILDNFEQIVEVAASQLHEWLTYAPELTILVTSRRRLELGGEVCFELPPLRISTDKSSRSEALTLFCQRAQQHQPLLDWTDPSLEQVAHQIVERLDGIPLAIELAAAQLRLLHPTQLLLRLDTLLSVLKGGPRTAAERHRTVKCAIEGSWQVLSKTQQQAFSACAIFRGGFSLEAAEFILADLGEPMSLLGTLRDHSLIHTWTPETTKGTRFGLYQTLRTFALEHATPEDQTIFRLRHAQWVATLPRLEDQGTSPISLQRLALERDNLAAAFDFSEAQRDAVLNYQVALRLAEQYVLSGPASQALEVLHRALALAHSEQLPPQLLAGL